MYVCVEGMRYTYSESHWPQQSIRRQPPLLLSFPQQKQEASLAVLETSTSRAGRRSQQPEGEEGPSVVVEPMPAAAAAAAGFGEEPHGGKKPLAAGPAVIGGQMRRLAWVAREREQAVCEDSTICMSMCVALLLTALSSFPQGDAVEAAQLRQAVAECQGWLEEAEEAASNNDGASSGKAAAAAGVAPHNRKGRIPQPQQEPQGAASGSKGAAIPKQKHATGAGAVGPTLRRRSSSVDTSLSVSSKAQTAQTAGGSGGSSLGVRMREAEAAWALGLDLADPRVVRGLKELQEVCMNLIDMVT